MVTLEEAKTKLARFTYKPGWKFIVDQGPGDRFEFVFYVRMPCLHRDTGQPIHVTVSSTCRMELIEDEKAFQHFVRSQVKYAETHEADECLLWDGVRIFDPHA